MADRPRSLLRNEARCAHATHTCSTEHAGAVPLPVSTTEGALAAKATANHANRSRSAKARMIAVRVVPIQHRCPATKTFLRKFLAQHTPAAATLARSPCRSIQAAQRHASSTFFCVLGCRFGGRFLIRVFADTLTFFGAWTQNWGQKVALLRGAIFRLCGKLLRRPLEPCPALRPSPFALWCIFLRT